MANNLSKIDLHKLILVMTAALQPELGHCNRSLLLGYGIENKCYQELLCTNIPALNSKAAFPNSSLNHQEANRNVSASGTHENFGILLTIQIIWVQKGPLAAPAVRIGKVHCKIAAILPGFGSLKLFPISTNFKNHQENIRAWAGGPAQTRQAKQQGLPVPTHAQVMSKPGSSVTLRSSLNKTTGPQFCETLKILLAQYAGSREWRLALDISLLSIDRWSCYNANPWEVTPGRAPSAWGFCCNQNEIRKHIK